MLIIHGAGRVTHIAAKELVGVLEAAGWSARTERATHGGSIQHTPVELVVGIDADVVAFRTAALNDATVFTINSGDPVDIEDLVGVNDEFEIRTSPIGCARLDQNAPTPIVECAIVTPLHRNARLAWASPITHQIDLDAITSIGVDVPDPMRRSEVSRPCATAMGAVMTFHSDNDSSAVLLHPDDDYTITTVDGTDVVVQIDQHIYQRGRSVNFGTHPVGLRVVSHHTGPRP